MTVAVDAEGVVAFTQELVRIRSVHDPAAGSAESAAAAAVVEKMRSFGWSPVVTEVAPGRPNVVAVVPGGGGPGATLLFEGHTDVVTEGDLSDWTVDPFGGSIVDGRLFGRGSADMKSGLAACLYAVRALQLAGPFPGRIVVCALVDEEGMMLGAKAFASSPLAREVDGAVIAEPEAGEICLVAKGAIRLRVSFAGAMAHGAMPQHGRNPILAAGRLLGSLADLQAELQKAHPSHEHLGEVYLTPTVLAAGSVEQINVIPSHCTVCVDVRTIPGVSHASVVSLVESLAASAGAPEGVRSSVSVVDDRPPVDTPSSHPLVGALAAAHSSVYGTPAEYGGVPGATDGTILTRDAGMVTIVYGPGGKWIAHQADEFVEVDEIVNCTRVFAETARLFLGG
ncbi:M20 family metallopeptidase [Tenggerimyces flavus]|uniref:Probable succinyl-diaminopimelate desuccinylase n=1 Tax=Tenggerimyces flavus TaxID=1708749 RepID=A0ABV7YMP2_9ACTN|nr:M20 family metallopeptidase [Tenggerimyces flavus]MBM7787498.1 succinyl-diaminopimelate desuccinylase [Tenggerimyces flavus]